MTVATKVVDELDGSSLSEEETLAALEADERRRVRRRRVLVLATVVLVFVATRAIAGYVTEHPDLYGEHRANGTSDVLRYDLYTWEMRHEGASAYGTLKMEYPPGAIPLMLAPRYLRLTTYRIEFIVQMVLVDALGLLALWRLARRTGNWWGVGTWLVLVPALGPVAYARLDLAVAVALLWAVERAHAGRWGWAGALLGVGAAVKLVPILLLPLLVVAAPKGRRVRVVGAASAAVGAALVPFALVLPDVYRSVIGYHADRGVQVESVWAAGLLVAHHVADYPVRVVESFGAYDVISDVSPTLKFVANVAALVVVGLAVWAAARTARGDVRRLSLLLLATLTLCIGVGRVFSPQYVVWLIGLAAAAVTLAPRAARLPVALLAVTVVLTHVGFPYLFWDLIGHQDSGAVEVLVVRDAMTLALGASAAWAWHRAGRVETFVVQDGVLSPPNRGEVPLAER